MSAVATLPVDGIDIDEALRPALFEWLCRVGDNTLILGHRLSEWCGRGPALEEDIALANTSLDLIGHTQFWLELAGRVEGAGRTADDLAFRRDVLKYRNALLVELPRGDMAVTTVRQFLYDAFYYDFLLRTQNSKLDAIGEIAAKAHKEVAYHLERSYDLVVRLGDGTAESHRRMQDALDLLWPYAGELFRDDAVDEAVAAAELGPLASALKPKWLEAVEAAMAEATLETPPLDRLDKQSGGKTGRHTEHLGHLLAEMQFLQRAYPGARW